jgi:transcriptional regulator with PAS, ATPase and Fis domain
MVFVRDGDHQNLLPELESPRPQPAATAHLQRQRWDSELLLIQKALHQARGNREAAARVLGISRSSLWRKMKAYDLL